MKARVTVSFKKSILDPQGQTIRASLNGHGHPEIVDVRQGKVFEVSFAEGADAAKAKIDLEDIARDILANPVIEDYRVEWLD